MAAQMGGLSQNERARALVRRLGEGLVARSFAAKSPYKFSFHVLADARTVNAFALPGGPIFITEGLLRLLKSEAEVAAVLGHEIGQVVGSAINMSYGRDDELESDALGIRIMAEGGYDPRAMIRVMGVLAKASGGSRQPEFFSTHPAPENRIARIREEIATLRAGNFERR
jgi:predicted Zn-dependent protease